jgi:hypothetical protein
MTGYINALKLRFEDRDAKDEAYAELEKVRYEGCIRDMFTQIQTLNDKAEVTRAAFKKLILERLPHKILEQMHTVDLTGTSDQEIVTIITNAGRTAEKWEAARSNLGLKNQVKTKERALSRFRRNDKNETPKKERRLGRSDRSDKKKFKKERRPRRDDSKTAGIESSELQRRRSAGECLRCAWPSDRKGSHRVADCKRPIKLDVGTAAFPNAKEYQKLKVAAMEMQENDKDSSSESSEEKDSDDDSSEESDEESEGEYLDDEEKEQELQEEEERNWWDTPPSSEED